MSREIMGDLDSSPNYFEIKSITLRHGRTNLTPWHGLSQISGINSDGSKWQISSSKAIDVLLKNKMGFYLKIEGRFYNVTVKTNSHGYQYLGTDWDQIKGGFYAIMQLEEQPIEN